MSAAAAVTFTSSHGIRTPDIVLRRWQATYCALLSVIEGRRGLVHLTCYSTVFGECGFRCIQRMQRSVTSLSGLFVLIAPLQSLATLEESGRCPISPVLQGV